MFGIVALCAAAAVAPAPVQNFDKWPSLWHAKHEVLVGHSRIECAVLKQFMQVGRTRSEGNRCCLKERPQRRSFDGTSFSCATTISKLRFRPLLYTQLYSQCPGLSWIRKSRRIKRGGGRPLLCSIAVVSRPCGIFLSKPKLPTNKQVAIVYSIYENVCVHDDQNDQKHRCIIAVILVHKP